VFSSGAGVFVAAVGAVAFAGWVFDLPELKTVYAGITIKANTALALLLAGVSLALFPLAAERPGVHITGQICAVAAALIGALTLSEHLTGVDLHIDELLFTEPAGERATASPGRMGPPASSCLTLAGIALALLYAKAGNLMVQVSATLIALIAVLALLGYAYSAEELYGVARYTGIALQTAIALLVLALGLFAARPETGIVSQLAGNRAGAILARRLLFLVIGVPFGLGWLRLVGQRAGYYDLGFGTALLTLGIIVIFVAVVWRTAARLNELEDQRRAAEAARDGMLARTEAAREHAEAALRVRDEFLSTISHELRTPLMAILGWAHLLGRGGFDAEAARRGFKSIERSAKAQAKLVEDLLDASAIITGKLTLNVRPVRLGALIEATIDSLRPALSAKGIHLQLEIDTRADEIHGDPIRLQQVVWNLLSNAVKFTPRDGTIRIASERSAGEFRVVVADNGAGMNPSFVPFAFDRFRQEDGGMTRPAGGLGLGLAIARHLIELHGGTLDAHSDGTGLGSTFTVRLPLVARPSAVPAVAPASPAAEPRSEAPPPRKLQLAGTRILVVDDDPDTLELLLAVLGSAGAVAQTASSTAEAVEIFQSWTPDAVISDIAMPEEDGCELIKRIGALQAAAGIYVPAIALTGRSRPEERQRFLEAGFERFFAKPIMPAELVDAVAELIARRRAAAG
jgi:signal transduction histidine kinase/ActR/RegA family two-component response regulator